MKLKLSLILHVLTVCQKYTVDSIFLYLLRKSQLTDSLRESATWWTVNVSPAQQLLLGYNLPKCRIRGECVFALTPAALCMYEHVRLCKIHLCHHMFTQVFVLVQVQDRTRLAVTRGQVWCQTKQRGVSAFSVGKKKELAACWCPLDSVKTCPVMHSSKLCSVFVVSALQKWDQLALSANNRTVECEYKC